jgi:hypothetical protein
MCRTRGKREVLPAGRPFVKGLLERAKQAVEVAIEHSEAKGLALLKEKGD